MIWTQWVIKSKLLPHFIEFNYHQTVSKLEWKLPNPPLQTKADPCSMQHCRQTHHITSRHVWPQTINVALWPVPGHCSGPSSMAKVEQLELTLMFHLTLTMSRSWQFSPGLGWPSQLPRGSRAEARWPEDWTHPPLSPASSPAWIFRWEWVELRENIL